MMAFFFTIAICLLSCVIHTNSFRVDTVSRCRSTFTPINMAGFGAKKEVVVTTTRPADAAAPCACGSGALYGECCQPFHTGKATPPNPVKMVRSRFSALVYKVIPYMMLTTAPTHKEYVDIDQKSKRKTWEKDLKSFADEYNFVSLTFKNEEGESIVAEDADKSTVSFTAKMSRISLDRPPEEMIETSTFVRAPATGTDKDKTRPWLYQDAVIKNPFKNIRTDIVGTPVRRTTKELKGVANSNQN
mmetsp:Transcript_28994/g.27777  ORF Transcript_28994/g.27777 Transcript_28994/m.27777 type:complete len:245 (-) Transcript_28994:114-848(-)